MRSLARPERYLTRPERYLTRPERYLTRRERYLTRRERYLTRRERYLTRRERYLTRLAEARHPLLQKGEGEEGEGRGVRYPTDILMVHGGTMMTEFFNRRQEKDKRRELRREMTPAEVVLWDRLRDRQAAGLRFRRQHSAGVFILDFYCPARMLAVELDGSSHDGAEAQEYDAARTEYLEAAGIRVLRFANADVLRDAEAVVKAICATAGKPSLLHPLLSEGEGGEPRRAG